MKIGLIGLPNAGKTTVFNALTGSEVPVASYSMGKSEPNLGTVHVMDERVTRLSQMYHPRKTLYATVEFVDFSGHSGVDAGEGLFEGSSLAMIRNMDALALVVRNFDDDLQGPSESLKDIKAVEQELLVADLIVAEARLERIRKGYGRGQRSEALQREEKLLLGILEHLNGDRPLRDLEFIPDEEKMIRGFQFLSKKALMVVLNSHEDRFGKDETLLGEIAGRYRVVEFAGRFEMELSRLDDEEAGLFMEDMGIPGSASRRLCRLAYETLGYISFFTVGEDEVRAWNIHRGETALDAAAAIHTDLARGFIRAECFSFQDCMECGSEKRIRERGLFRLEGKDYAVRDGDILNIRFNV
ncbi:MAG: redox-regulated ATPase YchF [Deltaproteobacteria bacterium]|nr:redox-regulated ATPase YchF [Deltaproteobacteria bacterium]